MAYIEWKEELDTGISVIDGQHKRIVTYINQLHDISESNHSQAGEVATVITALVDYTISHFAFEESLLADASYEHTTEHIGKHDDFRNKIYAFKTKTEDGEDVAGHLLKLLQDWLFGHILEEDGQYVSVLRQYLEEYELQQDSGWLKKRIREIFN